MDIKPNIGQQYDKIAEGWNEYHRASDYGVAQVRRALSFASQGGTALDVGCGSGGRLMRLLESAALTVTAVDASCEMVKLAKSNHPHAVILQDDIRQWDSEETFDFILAWDSLFHLPLKSQQAVLEKLCRLLSPSGVMIHSLGDDIGEHTDCWKDQTFYYSSIGVTANIEILNRNGLTVWHTERDQYPEKHAFIISQKLIR